MVDNGSQIEQGRTREEGGCVSVGGKKAKNHKPQGANKREWGQSRSEGWERSGRKRGWKGKGAD